MAKQAVEHNNVNVLCLGEKVLDSETAKKIVREAIPQVGPANGCSCHVALKTAIMTDRSTIPKETKKRLELIAGKYL